MLRPSVPGERAGSYHGRRLISMHRQADVVFGQRLRGGARTDYMLEFGKLPALIERIVVVEAMQHGSHPPGKALHFPDADKEGLRIFPEQAFLSRAIELSEGPRQNT